MQVTLTDDGKRIIFERFEDGSRLTLARHSGAWSKEVRQVLRCLEQPVHRPLAWRPWRASVPRRYRDLDNTRRGQRRFLVFQADSSPAGPAVSFALHCQTDVLPVHTREINDALARAGGNAVPKNVSDARLDKDPKQTAKPFKSPPTVTPPKMTARKEVRAFKKGK